MNITPEKIVVKPYSSSVLMNIATDPSLQALAEVACHFTVQELHQAMQGKHSIAKLLYYLYCQELKIFRLIKNRQSLLSIITDRLIEEQTEIQKINMNPVLKEAFQEKQEERISIIKRLEKVAVSTGKSLESLTTKLQQVKDHRQTISNQFIQEAVKLKGKLSEDLKKNGIGNTEEHQLYKAIQVLLKIVSKDLSPEEQQARLKEIPDSVKQLIKDKLHG